MVEQRLPAIDGDEGHWGEILNQFLAKEHYNSGIDNAENGGHQKITIRGGTAAAGTAPLKFTSGTLLTTPEAGAVEFSGDSYYVTDTSGPTRRKIAAYDDTSGATGDIYYRNSSGYFTRLGVGNTGDLLTVSGGIPSWSPTIPNSSTITIKDTNFTLQDNGDTTKQLQFELSGITTGTTRTLTVPDASTTLVGTDATQTLTNKTLSGTTNIAQSGELRLYNTADQTTNYERLKMYVSSNVFTIESQKGGTGTQRTMAIVGGQGTITLNRLISANGSVNMTSSIATAGAIAGVSGGLFASSGAQNMFIINAGVAQSGTASYTALLVNPSETSVGSGPNLLADFQVGGVSKAKIDNTGVITSAVGTSSGNVVTIDGAQTLTNKTLTAPRISVGSYIADNAGSALISSLGVPTAVNYIQIANAAAGNSPAINMLGSSTNIGLNIVPKGTGTVQANGVDIATVSGTQTLTNKTIVAADSTPIVTHAVNGNLLQFSSIASGDSYIEIANNISGTAPRVSAVGSASNIPISIGSKGTGNIFFRANNQANSFAVTSVATSGSVNYLQANQVAAGSTPSFSVAGSSDTNVSINLVPKGTGTVQANGVQVVDLSSTQTLTNKTLTTPVLNGVPTGTGVATAATANTLALRDASGNIAANNINANALSNGFTTTATAAGTTTLTISSTGIQEFTGTSTQTVILPTTSVAAGGQYTIINNSTGAVTVQSSGANTITILAGGTSAIFTANVATPTTAANWDSQYLGNIVASGKALTVSNSLTLAGTDGTTMTFPSASDTVTTLAATQTLTNKTIGNTNTITTKAANFTIQDGTDTTKQVQFDASGITTATTRTLTVPDASTTLVGTSVTQTLTNKTIGNTNIITVKAPNFTIQDNTDTTKQLVFSASGITTGTTRTLTVPDISDTLVTLTATQTLTNKTLTTPAIGTSILDANGKTILRFNPAGATAANWIQLSNRASGGPPYISALGSDTNIDIDFIPKGTGKLTVNGVGVVDLSSAQTLTNKTLSGPKINSIYDSTFGQVVLQVTGVSTVANWTQVTSVAAGNAPQFAVVGTDTNINLNLVPKGTGTVQANGVDVVTTSGTQTLTNKTLTTPVLNGIPTGTGVATAATANTLALRDASGNIAANNINANALSNGFTTTATAAGTTTLTISSTGIQEFTGTSTQTVILPTTSVAAGGQYTIINNSTGAVTVQSSGANTITILAGGTSAIFTANVATPTTAANWDSQYLGNIVASGKSLTVSNSLTLAGTDSTTMTFPGASDTVTTLAATQTLTNKTLSAPQLTGSSAVATGGDFSIYKTSDQTTNYERGRLYWLGSTTFVIATEKGGSGSFRNMLFSAGGPALQLNASVGTTSGGLQFSAGTSLANSIGMQVTGTLNAASGIQSSVVINNGINQSSTAGYTMLLVNPTETATGSGTKLLADFQVGGVSKAKIDNSGVITAVAGTASGNVVTIDGTQSLTNKTFNNTNTVTLKSSNLTIQDSTDTTKQAQFQLSSITTGTTRTYTLPDASGTILLSSAVTVVDSGFTIQDDLDTTKQLKFQLSEISTATTRTLTVPDANTTLVGTDVTQTLTAKTLSGGTLSGTTIMPVTGILESYNTADQTTNVEKVIGQWISNTYEISTYFAGTGTSGRSLRLGIASTAGATAGRSFIINNTGPFFQFSTSTTNATSIVSIANGNTWSASSGTQNGLLINPTINQSGTASYTGLLINPTETATGSGTKLLADFQVGGVSKAKIDNTGVITATAGTSSGNVVTIDGTQTLTNKTISGPSFTGVAILPQSATLELYNTADQTTNYEKTVLRYNSNVAEIGTLFGGTATTGRSIRIGASATAGASLTRYFQVNPSSVPFWQFMANTSATGSMVQISNPGGQSFTAASGNQTFLAIDPNIGQSGTAGYTGILVNPTETATGSGTKLLADFQVGGVSKVKIDNAGVITAVAGTTAGSVVTIDGTQTLSNKTLSASTVYSNPKIGALFGSAGEVLVTWNSPGATAVNYLQHNASATGNALVQYALGSDTDISIGFNPKGAGTFMVSGVPVVTTTGTQTLTNKTFSGAKFGVVYSDVNGGVSASFGSQSASSVNRILLYGADTGAAPIVAASGSDTNISLNLTTKGTGTVQANGVDVVTTTGNQTLTNKTFSGAKLGVVYSDVNGGVSASFGSQSASSVNRILLYGADTGAAPIVAASGSDTNISLNLTTKGTGTVQANGVDVVTTSATQTLTNKTLTTPRIGRIWDTNGNIAIDNIANASAVNYLQVSNGAAGAGIGLNPNGSDTNINFYLNVKGTGQLAFREVGNRWMASFVPNTTNASYNYLQIKNADTALAPSVNAVGSDTNVSLNLVPKGTGTVQAGGIDVVTTTATQTLTNKIVGNTNTVTLKDTLFTLQDDSDSTKQLQLQLSGITTGTTRTLIVPDASGTLALTSDISTAGGGMLAPVQGMALGSETFTISAGSVTQIAGTTINGYSPAVGDRILIAGAPAATGVGSAYTMTTQPANGIYTVTSNTTNLTVSRASDMSGSVKPGGLSVYVENATWPGSQTVFFVDTPNDLSAFTWGTTNLRFTYAGGPGGYAQQVRVVNNALGYNIWNGTGWVKFNGTANAGTQTLTLPATATDTIVARTSTDTLTNKRITARISSITSSATPSINVDTIDQLNITALAVAITSMSTNLTGTPTDGQKLMIRIRDNGTPQTITWGASFQSSGAASLLSTTSANKTHHIGFIYDSTAGVAKWICIAVDSTGY